MNKIKQLLKRGWQLHIRQTDDEWYDVGFSHNTIGEVSVMDENLNDAINKCFEQAKETSLEYLQW